MGAAMPTPGELREQSFLYREKSEKEDTFALKRMLARHALALAQLADRSNGAGAPTASCVTQESPDGRLPMLFSQTR